MVMESCFDILFFLVHSQTSQTGHTEQFEQVIFNVRPLRIALWVHRSARWMKVNSTVFSVAALTTVSVAVALYYLPNLLSKI